MAADHGRCAFENAIVVAKLASLACETLNSRIIAAVEYALLSFSGSISKPLDCC